MKKLKNLRQTHGKIERQENSLLDNIFKSKASLNYTHDDLMKMELKQLYLLAVQIGIPPIDNKTLLITRMTKELTKQNI